MASLGRVEPKTPNGCEECLATGGEWVQLRLCMTCGHVGCCDSSEGQHATGHFHATGHPVIRSFQPGDTWAWCYVHELKVDALPRGLAPTG
jgi:CPA1 family monovalent cation:H+ antiporter